MDLKGLLNNKKTGLIREYDDNCYDRIRVYKSKVVKDLSTESEFVLQLRRMPGLHIESIFFENLQLREEEGALPVEEPGDISERLLRSYLAASDIDLVKFVGTYQGKRIEIGIDNRTWELWLRIWHLTDKELETIENQLCLV